MRRRIRVVAASAALLTGVLAVAPAHAGETSHFPVGGIPILGCKQVEILCHLFDALVK